MRRDTRDEEKDKKEVKTRKNEAAKIGHGRRERNREMEQGSECPSCHDCLGFPSINNCHVSRHKSGGPGTQPMFTDTIKVITRLIESL